jgi:hypothetical protein
VIYVLSEVERECEIEECECSVIPRINCIEQLSNGVSRANLSYTFSCKNITAFPHKITVPIGPHNRYDLFMKVFLSLLHTFSHSLSFSLVHSFVHSFIHSLILILIHSLIHSFIHSFTHFLIHSFIHSFTHSLIHSFTHSLSLTDSLILSLTHTLSFIVWYVLLLCGNALFVDSNHRQKIETNQQVSMPNNRFHFSYSVIAFSLSYVFISLPNW